MARVNRTTGFFLILGVVVLLGTVAGTGWVTDQSRGELIEEPTMEPSDTGIFTSGVVDVASGLSVLVPSAPGKVMAVNVKEGDVVTAGQILVQLDDKRARDDLGIAEQGLAVAKARLLGATQLIKDHQVRIATQEVAVQSAKGAYTIAYEAHQGGMKQRQTGLINESHLKQLEVAAFAALETMRAAEKALAELKSIDPKVLLKEHEEALKEADLKVQAAKSTLDAYVIKAPTNGRVFEINYHVGGSAPLAVGDPKAGRALVFCPNEPMIVRAEIDQEWAMEVRPGMKADLTFRGAGREYKWTGTVEKVSAYIQRARPRSIEPNSFNDSATRECIIRISPDPKNPVLPGMRMAVHIYTGTQP